ncbi:hypothetical protein FACS189432_06930 [Bacteroidia bacterium]|nr:hypothetical protein FACS189426_10330 [Bacteroidia bacterium]GHT28669.1 hypothetical protein FACS189432_06930 [Bacteroidia bacterium]
MCAKIDKNKYYILGNISVIIAGILIGLGIGIIFDKWVVGILTGLGMSLFVVGIILLKTYKRLDIFEKDKEIFQNKLDT